ncbi:Replication protein A 32 kDa subunit [Microtus ochrogaster]|uniref:Replication protein A 32 kDa subunit n=1 Tax=Microtus ochrogaster TaxID=79684 RepID=A0A8J6G187_MICOH|nr:Replication protein A 32 kDa subunit [Microtus ochrogaster]
MAGVRGAARGGGAGPRRETRGWGLSGVGESDRLDRGGGRGGREAAARRADANDCRSLTGGFDSFGGSSYGGAGGYTQSPGGFGSPTASQAEKKSRARVQHIVPCTISQLLSATLTDEVFKIGNVEISQVTIVGIIRNAEKAPTNIVYKVDDMTAAPMDVRQWVDTDDASGENTVVPPETYVKVAGHLRSFQNKKSLVAFKIIPLEDMNEFTAHILEVVNAHMLLSKSNNQVSAGRPSISNSGMGEPGNFSGNNFMPANGLTVVQNQVEELVFGSPRFQYIGTPIWPMLLETTSVT